MKGHIAAAACVVGVLLLSGCSSDGVIRGQLSQSAGDAASAARSAGFVLGLEQNGRLLATVSDTGLSDAGDKLGAQAKSVSAIPANGGIAKERDYILTRIHTAQAAVLAAQDAAAADRDNPGEIEAERVRLNQAASQLAAASKRLESHG